jgi:hypothetical protein
MIFFLIKGIYFNFPTATSAWNMPASEMGVVISNKRLGVFILVLDNSNMANCSRRLRQETSEAPKCGDTSEVWYPGVCVTSLSLMCSMWQAKF